MTACVECGDAIAEPSKTGPYCAFCRRLRMPVRPDLPDRAELRQAQRRAGCRP